MTSVEETGAGFFTARLPTLLRVTQTALEKTQSNHSNTANISLFSCFFATNLVVNKDV